MLVLLLALGALSSAAETAELTSVLYRKLKTFLKEHAQNYENVKIEWIGGHIPTAYFMDATGVIQSHKELPDMGLDMGELPTCVHV
eukprot:g77242.t1